MDSLIRLVGPEGAVELFGVRLVGVSAENGKKLLLTAVFVIVVSLAGSLASRLARRALRAPGRERAAFWARQSIMLATALLLLVGLISIWFDDPGRLTVGLGLVTAGLAFALQRVITAVAGYFVILRGRTFNVGDRIVMGGVRGDVIALGFTQTTILEMGQPPPVQSSPPPSWVRSREYTGRVVTVTNAKIFEDPVYNYTRELPYLWEEIVLPIAYGGDHARAEQILLEAAERHTVRIGALGGPVLEELQRRYLVRPAELGPRVYYRLTDNWVELTARFLVEDHGIRAVKDAIGRDVLRALGEAGIGIASATYEIVGMPPLRVEGLDRAGARAPRAPAAPSRDGG